MRKEILSPWLAVCIALIENWATLFNFCLRWASLLCAGLLCCALAFSSCGEAGLLFVVVHGFLVAMASFVVKHRLQGLPWLTGKKSACNEGDVGLIPGSGRSPGGGNGNPLQYSCLEHPMDRRAWRAPIHGVTKESDTT